MNTMEIKLEQFEGPLDLLLHLISTNEMDIYDIQISVIIDQYMQYIYTANELNIALAGDFIVMAATLLEIKSKKLLPEEPDEKEETIDPEQQLIDRLIEYKVFKLISEYVKGKEAFYRRIITKEPEYYAALKSPAYDIDVTLELLSSSMSKVLKKCKVRLEEIEKPYTISREEISVEDMMLMIAKQLKQNHQIRFFSLFPSSASKSRVVAIFLAVLELYKTGDIMISQDHQYADILIEAKKVA